MYTLRREPSCTAYQLIAVVVTMVAARFRECIAELVFSYEGTFYLRIQFQY